RQQVGVVVDRRVVDRCAELVEAGLDHVGADVEREAEVQRGDPADDGDGRRCPEHASRWPYTVDIVDEELDKPEAADDWGADAGQLPVELDGERFTDLNQRRLLPF